MTIVAIRRTTRIDERDRLAGEMHDLYQNAPCGYHSANAAGVIVRINDTELAWLGYARGQVVDRLTLASLVAPRQRKALARAWAMLRECGSVRDVELDLRRSDGSVLPALLSAVAVTDASGRFVQSRATVFDITRRRCSTTTGLLPRCAGTSSNGAGAPASRCRWSATIRNRGSPRRSRRPCFAASRKR